MIERRMAERERLALSIEYDLGAAAGSSEEITYRAEAQDICNDGLRILTDQPLRKGAILRLRVPVSSSRMQIPVFAEVAWALLGDNRVTAGLRFLR